VSCAARTYDRRGAYDPGTTSGDDPGGTPGPAGGGTVNGVIPTSWRAYRPPAADVAIAVAFVAFGQFVTWVQPENPESFVGPRLPNAILSLLIMSALAWRRRAPLAAVSWAVVVYCLSNVVVPHDVSFFAGAVPLIVLTASAGYYCPRQRAIAAAAIAMTGAAVLTLTTPALRTVDSLIWNTIVLLGPWLMARGLRRREEQAASLAAALATERATREAALGDAAAEERAHIARELHDIVAHSVSVMVVQMGAARMQLPAGATGAEGPLLAAEDVGRQALADLRRLLGVLRADEPDDPAQTTDPLPPQPGLGQLDALVAQARAAGVDVAVQVQGDPIELPAVLDLTAYRIVQEALTNTLKHSGAASATVRLDCTSTALVVEVVDDGRPPARREGTDTGHGLVGIAERVSLFGGDVTAGPGPGRGWRVRAELPIPDASRLEQPAALPAS
jgi:signal transduction histidine kinase